MIPLRDHNRARRYPLLTHMLIAANVVVFLQMLMMSQPQFEAFVKQNALFPSRIMRGEGLGAFVTSLFLHAGLLHLVSNMWFLYVFGDNLEDRLGPLRFIGFYVLCGVIASLSQIAVDPSSDVPHLGASGAIAGVMGGYLMLFPQARVDVLVPLGFFFPVVTVPAYGVLLYWAALQWYAGVGTLGAVGDGGVAYFAHLGGFVAGVVCTRCFYRGRRRGWL